jgi:hypothetical protein
VNRLRRTDVVFIVAVLVALAVGLWWPSTKDWLFFLLILPASLYWATARGLGGALRGDRSPSARAERKTAEYLAAHQKGEVSDR